MSTQREEDSRPEGGLISQRNTARDVPAAKLREGSVGTVAPRGLRGPSLLPGQGAPERIIAEDVELAVVLRDAETLDGSQLARTAAKRAPERRSPSPSPTPVSVEVPRPRSSSPLPDEYVSTPPEPSARSIQSGTLISIGSVDPRAPTQLSLPSPPPLSVAERVAYLGAEAVVDRTSVHEPRELPAVTSSPPFVTQRLGALPPEALPKSSSRGVPSSSGIASSARPSSKADSSAPVGQRFARSPASYSPVSPSFAYSDPSPTSRSASSRSPGSVLPSDSSAAQQFQIHSELAFVPREFHEDAFDLRSVATEREPLAGRKPLQSTDWTAHGLDPAQRDSEPSVRSSDGRSSVIGPRADGRRLWTPGDDHPDFRRTSVPLSWVLLAAAFALLLALLVAWVLRPPGSGGPPRAVDDRPLPVALDPASLPASREAPPPATSKKAERVHAAPGAANGSPRALNSAQKGSLLRAVSSPSAVPVPVPAPDSPPPSKQSIY